MLPRQHIEEIKTNPSLMTEFFALGTSGCHCRKGI